MNIRPEILGTPFRSVIVASVLVIISVVLLFEYRNVGVLNLHVIPAATTRFQVYWAAAGQPYSESRSRTIRIYENKHHYNIPLTDLRKVEKLRIDPATDTGLEVHIQSMVLYQDGLKPVEFLQPENYDTLRTLRGIRQRTTAGGGLRVVSADQDAQLEYTLVASGTSTNLWINICRVFILVGIAIAFVRCHRQTRRSARRPSFSSDGRISPDPGRP